MPFPPYNLSRERVVLQSLQGIAGIPDLLDDQCVGDSMFMRPVLDPLAPGGFFVHNLHNSLPSLVQMLKVRAMSTPSCHIGRFPGLQDRFVCLTIMQRFLYV